MQIKILHLRIGPLAPRTARAGTFSLLFKFKCMAPDDGCERAFGGAQSARVTPQERPVRWWVNKQMGTRSARHQCFRILHCTSRWNESTIYCWLSSGLRQPKQP